MKRLLFALAPLALTLLATPAFAVTCDDTGNESAIGFQFGFHLGEPYTEADQAEFDRMELRRHGVEATRVERWNGCLRAWVEQPGGGEIMEFYDPRTFQRVPLNLR